MRVADLKRTLRGLDERIRQIRAELGAIVEEVARDEEGLEEGETEEQGLGEAVVGVAARVRAIQIRLSEIRETVAADVDEDAQLEGSVERSARTEIRAALESAQAVAEDVLRILLEIDEFDKADVS